jgi:hypothetical protein
MIRAINAIQMQGNEDDDLADEEIHQLQLLGIPDVAVPPEQVAPVAEQGHKDTLMNISAAAYNGCPNDSTISLLFTMAKTKGIALADTGSTNTFLDLQFAIQNNISMTPAKQRTVKVAGGGLLSSAAIAYNCTFTVQGQAFTTDFRILELQGSDVILGVNWFKKYNPVTFDFIERSLTVGIEGVLHTFKDHLFPKKQVVNIL